MIDGDEIQLSMNFCSVTSKLVVPVFVIEKFLKWIFETTSNVKDMYNCT